MKKKLHFSPRYLIIALVAAVMLPVVIFPDRYIQSVTDGLNLFVINVFPALFPFFFFSSILSNLNFGYDLGLAMKKPLNKLFNAPPLSGYVFIMSLLCGYPVGAKILSDFYEKGLISQKETKAVAAFTSTSGPLFIVGTVGVTMLNNKTAGFIMLISHYLSALINGLIFRLKRKDGGDNFPLPPVINADSVLKDSMTSSLLSVAIVGGYVAVFNMVLAMASDVGIISFLSFPFKKFGLNVGAAEGLISGLIEITKGCFLVSRSGCSIKIAAPICSFIITNGGLSITLQSLTFLGKCKISPAYYLLTKLTQGILCFLICLGLSFLFL